MNSGESKILTWTPKYIKATAPKSCPINFVIGFRCTKSSTRPKTLIIKPEIAIAQISDSCHNPVISIIMIKVSIKTIPPVSGTGLLWFLCSALPGTSIKPIFGAIFILNKARITEIVMLPNKSNITLSMYWNCTIYC